MGRNGEIGDDRTARSPAAPDVARYVGLCGVAD